MRPFFLLSGARLLLSECFFNYNRGESGTQYESARAAIGRRRRESERGSVDMLKVREMTAEEMSGLLRKVGFGHLGCSRDGMPYVVPMNYAYDSDAVYFFTTEGTKTAYIDSNPEVCLQVEEVDGPDRWRSVMVTGSAERVARPEDLERAMQTLTEKNPTLTPAISDTRVGAEERPGGMVVYRIRPKTIDGRKTVE